MSYQKKYYFNYRSQITNIPYLVEFWQNTEEVLVAEEIRGHKSPFNVDFPAIDHKFQVVRGTGCSINLLSKTDMQFFCSLYHDDPTDIMVKHYANGVLDWLGYLDSEMMSEPYDQTYNYPVSITGNDGFGLMDRFSFLQIDESKYTGIKSKFELLQIIFAKIGLPFTEYRIALSTTFVGQSEDLDKSILHESYVSCANFYDEDDKPMTLREVVESIIAPYGAHIRAEKGNIYITDIHSLASLTTITYKRFTMLTGTYAGFVAIPNRKAISDVKYMGTGQQIERSGGVNRQVVSYSPYPLKTILEESLIGTDEFETVPTTWSTKDGYKYKTLGLNKYWNEYTPATFEISYFTDVEKANTYLMWPRLTTNQKVAYLKVVNYLNVSGATINPLSTDPDRPLRRRTKYYDGVAILITGNVLVKTKNNPYDDIQTSKNIITVGINYIIKVGSRYFDMSTQSWITTPTHSVIYVSTDQNAVIADQFVAISERIIVGNISEDITLDGNLELEIWSEVLTNTQTQVDYTTNSTDVQEIWLKDLNIGLVNFDGSEIQDNDIEYIGLLNRVFQNEGEKIELTCGTDSQFADRGKILKSDGTNYSDIKQWTRNAQTFKIEELLLNSLSSNYRAGFLTLLGMKMNNAFSFQNILTDTFISGSKMMVKSASINYADNIIECNLIEVFQDELTIVPDSTIT